MRFRCPSCKKTLQAGDELAGKQVACSCGAQFTAPSQMKPQPRPQQKPPGHQHETIVQCRCGTKLRVRESAHGKQVRCPCGQLVAVPVQSKTAQPAPGHNPNQVARQHRKPQAEDSRGRINPYATNYNPATASEPPSTANNNSEEIRRKHIQREASIRGIGTLWLVAGWISILLGTALVLLCSLVETPEDIAPNILPIVCGIELFLGCTGIILGRQLRALVPSARIVAMVILAIGLIAISLLNINILPLLFGRGTSFFLILLNTYFLCLLVGKSPRMFFQRNTKRSSGRLLMLSQEHHASYGY